MSHVEELALDHPSSSRRVPVPPAAIHEEPPEFPTDAVSAASVVIVESDDHPALTPFQSPPLRELPPPPALETEEVQSKMSLVAPVALHEPSVA